MKTKIGGVKRHRHYPAEGGYMAPSSERVGRGGAKRSAFSRRGICERCGVEIVYVPAGQDRMSYWRAV